MDRTVIVVFFIVVTMFTGCANLGQKKRFSTNSNGTVLDTATGLMWSGRDNGASINYPGAIEYCGEYRGGGFDDWRMPSQEELSQLFKAGIDNKGKGQIVITDNWVWAMEIRDSEAAFCSFVRDYCGWIEQYSSFTQRALPVRDSKSQPANSDAAAVKARAPQAAGTEAGGVEGNEVEQRLILIKRMYDNDLLTREEYDKKRKEQLDKL